MLPLVAANPVKDFSLDAYIRKPFFIPVKKKIDELFLDLQNAKTHMAIVIDEYGGTAGVVTIEDLVEEIVGNIFDEYDEEDVYSDRQTPFARSFRPSFTEDEIHPHGS